MYLLRYFMVETRRLQARHVESNALFMLTEYLHCERVETLGGEMHEVELYSEIEESRGKSVTVLPPRNGVEMLRIQDWHTTFDCEVFKSVAIDRKPLVQESPTSIRS